jgi:hypothetical protein
MCIIIQVLHYCTGCTLLYRVCIIIVCIFIQDVHYTGFALLYRVCIIIQCALLYNVNFCTGCPLLYSVCTIIQGVHYYSVHFCTGCALLYRVWLYKVCIIIQGVHFCTGCALYRVYTIIQNPRYYATRYFTSCRLTFSPTAANIRTLYDISFIVPNVLVHGIRTLNRKGYGRKRSRLTVSYYPSRCIKGVRKNTKRSLNKAKIRGRDSISDFSNTDQRCQSLNPKCN